METTTTKGRSTQAARTAGTLGLDDLAVMDVERLGALFAAGRAPESLAALDGHPRGRMLAVKHLDRGPVASALRSFAAARAFPWGGKSFASLSASDGTGVNRVHLGGRHNLFPFRTRIDASVVDGAPAVILDYDLPDNPWFIRAIHDEVRLVDEGLFLGPAMWKTEGGGHAFVLWFALDTRVQAPPVGDAAGAR